MSIQSEINRIRETVSESFDVAESLGGDPSPNRTIENLPDVIRSIPLDQGGVDTSDANATSDRIAAGYSAYVNGEKVNGSMVNKGGEDITKFLTLVDTDEAGVMNISTVSGGNIISTVKHFYIQNMLSSTANSYLVAGKKFRATYPLSNFGDATSNDVRLGKTFTSESGLNIIGSAILPDILNVEIGIGKLAPRIRYCSSRGYDDQIYETSGWSTFWVVKGTFVMVECASNYFITVPNGYTDVTLYTKTGAEVVVSPGGNHYVSGGGIVMILALNNARFSIVPPAT